MRLSEIIRLVWMNLIQNRTKVLLTSLGIIVGSATIVLVIAIGQGGQADVAEQFKNLNAGAIDIKSVEASAAQGPIWPAEWADSAAGRLRAAGFLPAAERAHPETPPAGEAPKAAR